MPIETVPIVVLFVFLIAIGVIIVRLSDLFAAAMLTGMFSLLSAGLFTLMDAVDVAFTEAAVGAGVSTVLILGTLALTSNQEHQQKTRLLPFAIVIVTGAALIYGTLDMPAFGDATAEIHQGQYASAKQMIADEQATYKATHASDGHAEDSHAEDSHAEDSHGSKNEHNSQADSHGSDSHGTKSVGLPNIVTSILASYRGYDTLGETGVIFTAGIGVMLLLGVSRRRREEMLHPTPPPFEMHEPPPEEASE